MKRGQIPKMALPVLALSMGLGAIGCDGTTADTRALDGGGPAPCVRGAIGCDDPVDVLDLKAELAIDPPNVAFGNVQVGNATTQVVLLRNTGNGLLVLEGASRGPIFDDAFTFRLNRMSIPPQGVAQIEVTFAPQSLNENVASIIVRANDANVPDAEIRITGTGVTTTLILDPELASFGNVIINTTKTVSLTLSNTSDVDASIELLEGQNVRRCTSGTNDPSVFCLVLVDRSIGPDGCFALRAGESTTLQVLFSPVIAGTRERGNFTLHACDNAACEIEVRLDGLGIQAGFRCDPTNLDFAQVNPGSCLIQTLTCENIANVQVTVLGWGPSTGAGQETSADFSFEASRVVIVNEGDAFNVDVTYCPDALGDDEGNLQFETDQPNPNRLILSGLTGTGG